MAEAKDAPSPFEIRIEILNTSVKVNVLEFGKGLDLGQLEMIETEFGVDINEIQGMGPSKLSAKRLAAWAYGLLLPKVPKLKPSDIRALQLETITAWFSTIGDQLDAADDAATSEADEVPLDGEEPNGSALNAADGDATPEPSGAPAATPESSGSPGWDPNSTSDPETSEA